MPRKLPWWKIRRELARVVTVLTHLPHDLFTLFFAARWNDRMLSDQLRVTDGAAPKTNRIAIYLIFPNKGLLKSHIAALDWLRENCTSAVLVSNLPLSDADRETAAAHAWQVIERPNFGYDFGGYRQGILHVADALPTLDRLYLLNDSAWFPLPGSQNWLDTVEALGVDYAGAASHFAVRREQPETALEQQWSYDTRAGKFHYASFALAMGPRILKDPDFLRFWTRFPMTTRKNRTVRRGEIGLSQWVVKRGYSHAATFPAEDLERILGGLSDARLLQTAKATIALDDGPLADVKARLMHRPDPTRAELTGFVLYAAARQGISYALQDLMILDFGHAFLKKSPLWLNPDARDITLRLAGGMDGPIGQIVQDEARALARKTTAARS